VAFFDKGWRFRGLPVAKLSLWVLIELLPVPLLLANLLIEKKLPAAALRLDRGLR